MVVCERSEQRPAHFAPSLPHGIYCMPFPGSCVFAVRVRGGGVADSERAPHTARVVRACWCSLCQMRSFVAGLVLGMGRLAASRVRPGPPVRVMSGRSDGIRQGTVRFVRAAAGAVGDPLQGRCLDACSTAVARTSGIRLVGAGI